MRRTIGEVIDMVRDSESSEEKVDVLLRFQSNPLKLFLKYCLDPTIEFHVPPGELPHRPKMNPRFKAGFSRSDLFGEMKRMYVLVKPHPKERFHAGLSVDNKRNAERRLKIFYSILENLYMGEAEIFLQMKDKTFDALTIEEANAAFPDLIVLPDDYSPPKKKKKVEKRKENAVITQLRKVTEDSKAPNEKTETKEAAPAKKKPGPKPGFKKKVEEKKEEPPVKAKKKPGPQPGFKKKKKEAEPEPVKGKKKPGPKPGFKKKTPSLVVPTEEERKKYGGGVTLHPKDPANFSETEEIPEEENFVDAKTEARPDLDIHDMEPGDPAIDLSDEIDEEAFAPDMKKPKGLVDPKGKPISSKKKAAPVKPKDEEEDNLDFDFEE